MKPVQTPHSNVRLTLTNDNGERDPDSDLPAERAVDQDGRQLVQTEWQLDDGERRALANGAPIVLRVWGQAHPPVSITAGDPNVQGSGVLLGTHVNKALGLLFADLADASGSDNRDHVLIGAKRLTPDGFITLFHRCLRETALADPSDT